MIRNIYLNQYSLQILILDMKQLTVTSWLMSISKPCLTAPVRIKTSSRMPPSEQIICLGAHRYSEEKLLIWVYLRSQVKQWGAPHQLTFTDFTLGCQKPLNLLLGCIYFFMKVPWKMHWENALREQSLVNETWYICLTEVISYLIFKEKIVILHLK